MTRQNRQEIPLEERLIFALDLPDAQSAEALIERLAGPVRFFKVGMQLFYGAGWSVVESIVKRGCKVMLDLKLHDIPETVRLTMRQFADRGVHFATVHAAPGVVEAALAAESGVGVLAVTVLTSTGQAELEALRYPGTVADLVQARAAAAVGLGCAGVVASAQEARMLRQSLGQDFCIVTPGIRPAGSAAGDQRRICTPAEAITQGADYLVIGRPIRDAAEPEAAVLAIQQEIAGALASLPAQGGTEHVA